MRATFQSGGPIPCTELREKMQLSRMAWPVQVQAQIKKGPAAKRLLASVFFAAGTAYIRARRIVEGVALQYAHRAPSMPRAMLAALTAAVLYPIYRWATCTLHGLSCCTPVPHLQVASPLAPWPQLWRAWRSLCCHHALFSRGHAAPRS